MRRLELHTNGEMVENLQISNRGLSRGEFNDKMWDNVEGLKETYNLDKESDYAFYLIIPSKMNAPSLQSKYS